MMNIHRKVVLKILKNAYYSLGQKEVKFVFFESPDAAFEAVARLLIKNIMIEPPKNGLDKLNKLLENQLTKSLEEELIEKMIKPLGRKLIINQPRKKISHKIELLKQQLRNQLKRKLELSESSLRKYLRVQIDRKLLKNQYNYQLLHQLHTQQKFSTEHQLISCPDN